MSTLRPRSGQSLLRHARQAVAAIPYADRAERRAQPVTLAQRQTLARLGWEGQVPATLGEASDLIERIKREQKRAGHSGAVLGVWLVSALLTGCASAPAPAQAAAPLYGWMGDSITRQIDQSALAAGAGVPLSSVVVSGVNGTTSRDWLPGRAYYNSALSTFQTAGVSVVSLCLGTNDAKAVLRFAPAEVELNLTLIGKGLLAAGMSRVVFNYSPYVVPGSGAGAWGTDAPDLVAAYNARREGAVAAINAAYPGRASVGDALAYDWFRDRQELLADGVHPGPAGNAWLSERWGSVARNTGIVLPESGAGMFLVVFLAFVAGSLYGRRGWRWWR